MDDYLEQAYLTVFSKAKEVMLFAWPYLVEHRFVPTLGFQLRKLDELMTGTGKCIGISEYHPVNSQGEDHLADYLGLLGIPFEPTPNFDPKQKTIFITAACCADKDILSKLEKYVRNGGRAIVTIGFVWTSSIITVCPLLSLYISEANATLFNNINTKIKNNFLIISPSIKMILQIHQQKK